jgi:carbonic anhydrase
MRITYTVSGQAGECQTQEDEDLREMAREIEEHVRGSHENLREDTLLPIRVADGLLNCLVYDAEEGDLGELTSTAQ